MVSRGGVTGPGPIKQTGAFFYRIIHNCLPRSKQVSIITVDLNVDWIPTSAESGWRTPDESDPDGGECRIEVKYLLIRLEEHGRPIFKRVLRFITCHHIHLEKLEALPGAAILLKPAA